MGPASRVSVSVQYVVTLHGYWLGLFVAMAFYDMAADDDTDFDWYDDFGDDALMAATPNINVKMWTDGLE